MSIITKINPNLNGHWASLEYSLYQLLKTTKYMVEKLQKMKSKRQIPTFTHGAVNGMTDNTNLK
jgi:hypothetical protein